MLPGITAIKVMAWIKHRCWPARRAQPGRLEEEVPKTKWPTPVGTPSLNAAKRKVTLRCLRWLADMVQPCLGLLLHHDWQVPRKEPCNMLLIWMQASRFSKKLSQLFELCFETFFYQQKKKIRPTLWRSQKREGKAGKKYEGDFTLRWFPKSQTDDHHTCAVYHRHTGPS